MTPTGLTKVEQMHLKIQLIMKVLKKLLIDKLDRILYLIKK